MQVRIAVGLPLCLHSLSDCPFVCVSHTTDSLVAAGLDSQLTALQERLAELQNQQKEKPSVDEDLEVHFANTCQDGNLEN